MHGLCSAKNLHKGKSYIANQLRKNWRVCRSFKVSTSTFYCLSSHYEVSNVKWTYLAILYLSEMAGSEILSSLNKHSYTFKTLDLSWKLLRLLFLHFKLQDLGIHPACKQAQALTLHQQHHWIVRLLASFLLSREVLFHLCASSADCWWVYGCHINKHKQWAAVNSQK